MITSLNAGSLVVVNDNLALYLGSWLFESIFQSVDGLGLSSESPHWRPTYDMLGERKWVGVGVINNYIYAVSYIEI